MKRTARPAVVVMALISIVLLAQGIATAGTITFVDLTDTITLSDDTGRGSLSCSTPESCAVTLSAPTGTARATLNTTNNTNWVEPGTNIVSDRFCVVIGCTFSVSAATFSFESDTEPGSLGTCPAGVTCGVENGLVQTVFTITWENAAGVVIATDTIGFQSDVVESGVPEPASIFLLLAGFGVVAVARRRPHR